MYPGAFHGQCAFLDVFFRHTIILIRERIQLMQRLFQLIRRLVGGKSNQVPKFSANAHMDDLFITT